MPFIPITSLPECHAGFKKENHTVMNLTFASWTKPRTTRIALGEVIRICSTKASYFHEQLTSVQAPHDSMEC